MSATTNPKNQPNTTYHQLLSAHGPNNLTIPTPTHTHAGLTWHITNIETQDGTYTVTIEATNTNSRTLKFYTNIENRRDDHVSYSETRRLEKFYPNETRSLKLPLPQPQDENEHCELRIEIYKSLIK